MRHACTIPSFKVWLLPANWTSLDGYLGKSLSSTLVALLHSGVPPSSLEPEDMARLASLPLEHLPPALKLGASLAVLSQVKNVCVQQRSCCCPNSCVLANACHIDYMICE